MVWTFTCTPVDQDRIPDNVIFYILWRCACILFRHPKAVLIIHNFSTDKKFVHLAFQGTQEHCDAATIKVEAAIIFLTDANEAEVWLLNPSLKIHVLLDLKINFQSACIMCGLSNRPKIIRTPTRNFGYRLLIRSTYVIWHYVDCVRIEHMKSLTFRP